MNSLDCIFCKITRGEIPAKVVHETEDLMAFFDINQIAPVHILVITKNHITSVNDLTLENASLIGQMVLLGKQLAKEHHIEESGFRLVMNTGKHGGQSVFHIHLHVMGGRQMSWPPG